MSIAALAGNAPRTFVKAVDDATTLTNEALEHLARSGGPVADPFASEGFQAEQALARARDTLQDGARVYSPGGGIIDAILSAHPDKSSVNLDNLPLVFTGAVGAARQAEELLHTAGAALRQLPHAEPVPAPIAAEVRTTTLEALDKLATARSRAFAQSAPPE